MANLRWDEAFKALFLAGILAYLAVWAFDLVWIGVPVLILFSWLFYDLRQKVDVFKRILQRELWQKIGEDGWPKVQKAWGVARDIAEGTKEFFWDDNLAKITTFTVPFLFCALLYSTKMEEKNLPALTEMVCFASLVALWALAVFICALIGSKKSVLIDGEKVELGFRLSDKKIAIFLLSLFWTIPKFILWTIPKFILWTIPKFLLKTTILTIRDVHSKELVAVAIYSLGGMGYIIAFPPFGLMPVVIFPLAIGCGLFTGTVCLIIHKVLLTSLAQRAFAKVEAW